MSDAQIAALVDELNGDQGDENLDLDDENAQLEGEAQSDVTEQDTDEGDALDDSDADEQEDGEDDQPEGESLDSKVVEWETAAGEKFSAPISELKAGYMRGQDYTHKTQELARDRDMVQQQVHQQYQKVEQYAQELGALQMQNVIVQQIETSLGQIDRHNDPVGYNAAVNDLIIAQRRRDGLAAQIAKVQQDRTLEQQQAHAVAQQQAIEALASGPDALPNFGKELVNKMNAAGRGYGLSDQELKLIVDPRHIRILHDAMQYRALQEKKPQAVNKAKAAPARPARQTRSVPASSTQRALKQFNANPSIESMARLMSATK